MTLTISDNLRQLQLDNPYLVSLKFWNELSFYCFYYSLISLQVYEKETQVQLFFYKFFKIFQNSYVTEHL